VNAIHEGCRTVAEELFREMQALSFDGVGITRESYGKSETAAITALARHASEMGLICTMDAAGNLLIDLPGGQTGPAILCGSHVDSVPQGGNYDGMAGVIAGMLCQKRLVESATKLTRPLRVIGLRGEESAWYGKAYLGSSALFGRLTSEDLNLLNSHDGKPLGLAMREAGADVKRIAAQEKLIRPDEIAAYLELHIEQGPVMVREGVPVAAVSAIRGNVRHNRVRCIGEPGHSGAVPRSARKDAAFAVSHLITRMDAFWESALRDGRDLVITFGTLGTNPDEHAVSRIPGEVDFSFEVRSEDTETLEEVYRQFRIACESVAAERGVRFEFDKRMLTPPARMASPILQAMQNAARRLGKELPVIPSGAGHDASVFSNAGVPSGMLFIRNEHGSHNPRESMEMDDFMKGVAALYETIMELQNV
jgi:N-carbamoyl-L-amino-acid hydrolase